jgi:hypothetical protein
MKPAVKDLARSAAPAAALARSRSRRKRFLITGTAALAVIGAAMGVSFLDSSGTAALNISSTNSTLVYPLTGASAPLPLGTGASATVSGPLTTTAFSGKSTPSGGNCGTVTENPDSSSTATCNATPTNNTVTAKNPSWSPVAGSAGTVTTAGDLAIVDATSATNYVTVNVYVSNLTQLAVNYGSFAFPVNVYSTTCPGSGSCNAWQEALTVSPYYTYLTDTSGVLTFNLAKGKYYDIVMEGTNHTASLSGSPSGGNIPSGVGGAFFTNQTDTTNGSLSPSFYFSAYSS